MRLSDFDYNLPKNLIAQESIKPRDHSRLLVVRRRRVTNSAHVNEKKIALEHKHFYDIVNYFKKGDVLVLNNSKVMPARLVGKKINTGGKVEVFLLHPSLPASLPLLPSQERGANLKKLNRLISFPLSRDARSGGGGVTWSCLLSGHGRKENLKIKFSKGLECEVISARDGSASGGKNDGYGTWEVKFNKKEKDMMKIIETIGKVPLPPYIKISQKSRNDKSDYQTVYADEKKVGSVAAPTAGFHFTREIIKKLKKKGVQFEYITLYVGLGTFAPVKTDNIKNHKMHSEYVEINKNTAKRIIKAKKEKRRIIAVGTTSVRALESSLRLKTTKNWTNIFIYPPFKFKIVDAVITNFHLPKSTLLMLVSAFAGKKSIDKVYKEAIRKKYRFYSYGDAMFIA